MLTVITFIVVVAIIALLAYCIKQILSCKVHYEYLMDQLLIVDERTSQLSNTCAEFNSDVALLNKRVDCVVETVDEVVKSMEPKQTQRYIKFEARRNEFKELRENFNYTINEAAEHMKISKKTAQRYEKWRINEIQ